MDNDLPERLTDNAGYMFLFYMLKLLINKFAERVNLTDPDQLVQPFQVIIKYLIKIYELVFKIQLMIEIILFFIAVYMNSLFNGQRQNAIQWFN